MNDTAKSLGVDQEGPTASSRATACIAGLEKVFRAALREGGPNAKASVSDVLRIIDAYQTGEMDDKPGTVTGPFYPLPPPQRGGAP